MHLSEYSASLLLAHSETMLKLLVYQVKYQQLWLLCELQLIFFMQLINNAIDMLEIKTQILYY